ncbi:MAG: hypothetical protein HQL43_09825 [Alphaproteobacteria bacterium]|nr:hypothetical protein [Alphaproteobacteria bacterium]
MKKLFVSLFLTAFLLAPQAQAAMPGLPDSGKLSFTVLRNKTPIGSHVYRFESQGERVTVKIETHILYKFLGFPFYRFDHNSTEVWEKGQLKELTSSTNDDGTPLELKIVASGTLYEVVLNGAKQTPIGTALPASMWPFDTSGTNSLFDTMNGKPFTVESKAVGIDSEAGQQLRHFTIRGEMSRDIWYDERGVLAHVLFKARDSSQIRYVRD